MNLVQKIQAKELKKDAPKYKIGDTVRVHFKIVEGTTERIQLYEGLVIAENNSGVSKTVTVRKNSYGVGVERIFPVHSSRVARIEVLRRGRVRRAKLYYIRDKVGKKSRLKELLSARDSIAAAAEAANASASKE